MKKNVAPPTVIRIPTVVSGKFELEHAEERSSRLNREALEARDRRIVKMTTHILCQIAFMVCFFACGWMSLYGTDTGSVQWSRSILSSLVGPIVGFLVGKYSK